MEQEHTIESGLESRESDVEQIETQRDDIERRQAELDCALAALEKDEDLLQALKTNEANLEVDKETLEIKRSDAVQQLELIEAELDKLSETSDQSQSVLNMLQSMGEDVTEGNSILQNRRTWLEECRRRVAELAERLGERYDEMGKLHEQTRTPTEMSAESAKENQKENKATECGDKRTCLREEAMGMNAAQQAYADYMSDRGYHYTAYDYAICSKDPKWQRLHREAFPDFYKIADHDLNFNEKYDWICQVCPDLDGEQAKKTVQAMEFYSGNGSDAIHWDKTKKLKETNEILHIFDNGNVKPYEGVIYRGLSFTSQEEAKKALRMGAFHRKKIWTEPGITSFSTTIGVAEKFAQNKGSWGIVLICRNNKSAIPFRHMSLLPHEDEVISPGGHQNLEWKIDKKSMSVDKKKRIIYIDITEL